jgi:hypothetical protein
MQSSALKQDAWSCERGEDLQTSFSILVYFYNSVFRFKQDLFKRPFDDMKP